MRNAECLASADLTHSEEILTQSPQRTQSELSAECGMRSAERGVRRAACVDLLTIHYSLSTIHYFV